VRIYICCSHTCSHCSVRITLCGTVCQSDYAKKQKELKAVKLIIQNNKYDTSILNEIRDKKKQEQINKKTKWEKFTYVGRETRCFTKLFRNTNVKITYTTNNNLGKLLSTQTAQKGYKYDCSGVYQLEWPTCNKKIYGPDWWTVSYKVPRTLQ